MRMQLLEQAQNGMGMQLLEQNAARAPRLRKNTQCEKLPFFQAPKMLRGGTWRFPGADASAAAAGSRGP